MEHRTEWDAAVNETLSAMTIEEKIGQLLHPFIRPEQGIDGADRWLGGVPVGGAFFFPANRTVIKDLAAALQQRSKVPLIFSSDLENGAGRMVKDATVFPDNMAIAATGNQELAYVAGKAAAREGRSCGMHWSFGPVVDINANPHNPITNTRSFGDDPDLVSRFSRRMIRGMQDHRMAATAKHFPGDGWDDRDHHLCTTINPLTRDEWFETSGRMFADAVAEGVWTVMPGHISLPSLDPGAGTSALDAPPAVMSRILIQEVLREQLGFDGVVITDAIEMGGSASWYPPKEVVVRALEAGCDMILFCDPKRDFAAIRDAIGQGRLSMDRIEASVKRILVLKHRVGLFDGGIFGGDIGAEEKASFESASKEIAVSSLTEVRRTFRGIFLEPGMKVLSYHVRGDSLYNVDEVDKLLEAGGITVIRRTEADQFQEVAARARECTAVIEHLVFGPSWASGRIRLADNYNRSLAEIHKQHHERLVTVSYGSPYHLYDYPRLPNLLNAYSPDLATQVSVVKYLFGELKAAGRSPVDVHGMLGRIGKKTGMIGSKAGTPG